MPTQPPESHLGVSKADGYQDKETLDKMTSKWPTKTLPDSFEESFPEFDHTALNPECVSHQWELKPNKPAVTEYTDYYTGVEKMQKENKQLHSRIARLESEVRRYKAILILIGEDK